MDKLNLDNRSIVSDVNSLSTTTSNLVSKERWEGIIKFKKDFVENPAADPYQCPYLNNAVAESWIRSKRMGISPFGKVACHPNLNKSYVKRIKEKDHELIEIVSNLIEPFKYIITLPNFSISVMDRNEVILYKEGNWTKFLSTFNLNPEPFAFAAENGVGTTSHALSINLNQPVILLGPEHYNVAFQNCVSIAVPIVGGDGEVIADLLILGFSDESLDYANNNFLQSCNHTLGFAKILAISISNQLILKNKNSQILKVNNELAKMTEQLQSMNSLLNSTIELNDDALINTNCSGEIIHINKKAARLVKLRSEELISRNIQEYINHPDVINLLAKNNLNKAAETFFITPEQIFPCNVHPVFNDGQLDGTIFKIFRPERKMVQINNQTGGKAKYQFEDIIGESTVLKKTIALGQRFSGSNQNVLLIGESGTGKELFAQAIHNSYRPEGPFIPVNCAAIPRELIESELLGYEGGSFTGADRSGRIGKIELANGGTLFLDEIGDMPLETQAVLLRVLEDKQVMRIGGRTFKCIDFRLISATNKQLWQQVEKRQFREDLYYRLAILTIAIPPLRERIHDLEILSNYFTQKYSTIGQAELKLSPAALKKIKEYVWPGNVRQLESAIIYAVNHAEDSLIGAEDLPSYVKPNSFIEKVDREFAANVDCNNKVSMKEIEKFSIESALAQTNHDIGATADMLGLSRTTLYRRIKAYNIK